MQARAVSTLFPSIGKTGLSSEKMCRLLLDKKHVLMLPGSVFGAAGEGHIPLSCTQDMQKLCEAFDRLEKLAF